MATTYGVTAWKNPKNAIYSKYGEYCAGWTNVANILSANGSGASLPSGEGINSGRKTAYLTAYNFSAKVPSNSVVVGIEIRITKKKITNGGTAKDYLVALRNGGLDAPRNIGRNCANGSLWGKSYFTVTYGSSRDKLGANLTPAIVNSSSFGINFRAIGTVSTYANIGVDNIQIRVHYAVTSNTTTPPTIIPPQNDDEPEVIIPENTTVLVTDWHLPSIVNQAQETHNPTLKNSALTLASTSNYTNESNGDSTLTWGTSGSNVVTSTSDSWYESKLYVRSNMGFNIPADAIIKGVKVGLTFGTNAENKANIGTNWYLQKPDGTFNNKTLFTHYATSTNTWRWIAYSLGGSSDLWGLTLTPADINSNDFKFKLKGGSVQPSRSIGIQGNITITVYYTTPDGVEWSQTVNLTDADDNTASTVSLAQNEISQDLKCSGYGFDKIIDTSQIIGVEARIVRQSSVASTGKDYIIKLMNTQIDYNNPNANFISNSKETVTYGNSTFIWNQENNLTPARIRNALFGLRAVYQNNASSTTTISAFTVALRVYYLPNRQMVQPNIQDMVITDSNDHYAEVSQAPTTYLADLESMECIQLPNQVRRQLGYIGMVNLERGHHYETVTRKNTLMKEVASGSVNYSKKGEIEEDRPLSLRVAKRNIKTLEGLVDLQGIIPVDTVIRMDDNDPYAHKGYMILHGIKHKRINDLLSECDIEGEYITKDLHTPLTVDYLIKTTPPLDANIITDTENSIFYLENDNLEDISDHMNETLIGTPIINKTDSQVSITLGSGDQAKYITKESVSGAFNVIGSFSFTKTANIVNNVVSVINGENGNIICSVSVNANGIVLSYGGASSYITGNIPTNATYTVKIRVDVNNIINVVITVDDGSTIAEYTDSASINSYPQLKGQFHSYYVSGSVNQNTNLLKFGITKRLFTDNIDTTIRNIIHIPEPLQANIPYNFIRKTAEGDLYSYLNPSREILFTLNPSNFFDTSVKLIDKTGARIISTDMVIGNQGELRLENGVIRVIFDVPNNEIKLYGFLYGWIYLGTLHLDNMIYVKPIQVTFDMIKLQVGETKWLLRRGKPFVEIEHPYDDLNIVDNFTHYWHDNGGGIGVIKDIESQDEPLNVNNLFYCNIWDINNSIAMQIFRPTLENLTVKKIPKSNETGIGWFNKLATENERHYELALEYLAKSNQDIYVYLG